MPMRLSVKKGWGVPENLGRQSPTINSHEGESEIEQAAEKERVPEERIRKLEELVMQQSLRNQKLQSMLDSQLSQPPPVQVVETATLTRTAERFVISAPIPTAAEVYQTTSVVPSELPADEESIAPPYMPPPMLSGPYATNTEGDADAMVVGRIPTGGINITYCRTVEKGNSPGPALMPYHQTMPREIKLPCLVVLCHMGI